MVVTLRIIFIYMFFFQFQFAPGPAPRGRYFGAVPLELLPVFPQARIVSSKKVTGPVPLECSLGSVPPKILLVLYKAWVKSRSSMKNTSERQDEA